MVGEVFAGISAFKTMFDIAKSLKDVNDAAVRKGVVIELQEHILAAQEAQTTLAEHVRTLKEEIAKFETWNTEKQRYELRAVDEGAFAYVLKKSSATSEPPHWLCTDCYERRKKSLLNASGSAEKSGQEFFKTLWRCHSCGNSIRVPRHTKPAFAEDTDEKNDPTKTQAY